jgi:hypothetical protein
VLLKGALYKDPIAVYQGAGANAPEGLIHVTNDAMVGA